MTRFILVLPLLVALGGCQSIRDAMSDRPTSDPNRNAVVSVQDAAGADVSIPVVVGSGEGEVRGVKALQIRDWTEASKAFAEVVAKDPKNYNAAFGLAVSLEAMGKFEEAAGQYKAANYIESKQANLDGIKRCEAKAGQ